MSQIRVFENDSEVASNVCTFIESIANDAISKRDIFSIGLSGGSAAKILCNGLPEKTTDWGKWRVFFCDERHVPFSDPECTYSVYKQGLMSKVPLSEQNVFPDNPDISVADAAVEYEKKIKDTLGANLPQFDLLVLGMGPDGHTCSLFPGHALLEENTKWIAAINDSPKPPPERITMTYPLIQNCKNAMFVACGAGKAQMVQRVIEGKEDPPLPAARVRPHNGQVHWFLDKPAASQLSNAQL